MKTQRTPNGTTEYLVHLTVTTSVSIYVEVDDDDKKQLRECDHDFIEAGLITDEALFTAVNRAVNSWGGLDITQDDYEVVRKKETA